MVAKVNFFLEPGGKNAVTSHTAASAQWEKSYLAKPKSIFFLAAGTHYKFRFWALVNNEKPQQSSDLNANFFRSRTIEARVIFTYFKCAMNGNMTRRIF